MAPWDLGLLVVFLAHEVSDLFHHMLLCDVLPSPRPREMKVLDFGLGLLDGEPAWAT